MQQFGGKDSKRHFTVVMRGKEHGLYVSSTPSSAAKKAVTKLCTANKSKKVEFSIREITQGSKKKTYGPYKGHIEKLKEPIELKGRIIRYKPVAKLSAKKGAQKGGFKIYEPKYELEIDGSDSDLDKITDEILEQILGYQKIVIIRTNSKINVTVESVTFNFNNNESIDNYYSKIKDDIKNKLSRFIPRYSDIEIKFKLYYTDSNKNEKKIVENKILRIVKNRYMTHKNKIPKSKISKVELEIFVDNFNKVEELKNLISQTLNINNENIKITKENSKINVTIDDFTLDKEDKDNLKEMFDLYFKYSEKIKIILYTFYSTTYGNKKEKETIYNIDRNKDDDYNLRRNKEFKDIRLRFLTKNVNIKDKIREIINDSLHKNFVNYTHNNDKNGNTYSIQFRGKTKLKANEIRQIAMAIEKKLKENFPQSNYSTNKNAAIKHVYGGYLTTIITEYWINHKGEEKRGDLID